METTHLSINLADYLPDPLPPECEFEFAVRYRIIPGRPASYHPWPGDPAEPETVDVQTCASDVVLDAWLFYDNQFVGFPPVSKDEFVSLTIKAIDHIIEHGEYN